MSDQNKTVMKKKGMNKSKIIRNTVPKSYACQVQNNPWGYSVLIIRKDDKASCRCYWFHDDTDKLYLDGLYVSEEVRRQGIGTFLQELREKIGSKLGFSEARLWVENGTLHQFRYERRGYKMTDKHYIDEYYTEPGMATWMKKKL